MSLLAFSLSNVLCLSLRAEHHQGMLTKVCCCRHALWDTDWGSMGQVWWAPSRFTTLQTMSMSTTLAGGPHRCSLVPS